MTAKKGGGGGREVGAVVTAAWAAIAFLLDDWKKNIP